MLNSVSQYPHLIHCAILCTTHTFVIQNLALQIWCTKKVYLSHKKGTKHCILGQAWLNVLNILCTYVLLHAPTIAKSRAGSEQSLTCRFNK